MTFDRHHIQSATRLAGRRAMYRLTPAAVRRAHLLRACTVPHARARGTTDAAALASYLIRDKFVQTPFMADGDDLAWYRDTDPFGSHGDTLARADAACAHRIDIANLGTVDLGDALDWTRDPVTGTQFPRNVFSLRPPAGVDERFRAELNCHRHFPLFATAWWLTRDERYIATLRQQWRSWLRGNPPIEDRFRNDGLETTARVLAWTHCFSLQTLAAFGDDGFILEILARIERYGHLIEAQYHHSAAANNHQVAEALGLLLIGTMYPELRQSQHWREQGTSLLQHELETQIGRSGVHVEQSAAYHLFVVECAQLALLVASRTQESLPQSIHDRTEAATEYLLHLRKPNGQLSALGDDCGLRLFSPTGMPGLRPTTALWTGAYLFDRPDFAAALGAPDEDVFWLVGRKGIEWLRAASAHATPRTRATVRADAGHAIVRSSWDPDAQYLHFDFGAQGLGERPGHGHDDVLSFELQGRGRDFIVDAGTHTYLRSNPLRQYFTGALAHNTLLVDAPLWTRTGGSPHQWPLRAGRLVGAAVGEGIAWFSAAHLGYADAPQAVEVQRSLLVVSGEYVLVIDQLTGSGTHDVEALFHTAPDLDMVLRANGALCRGASDDFSIVGIATEDLQWSAHRGHDAQQPSWYSERYGALTPAWTLRSRIRAAMPFWQVIGLFPGAPNAVSNITLRRAPAAAAPEENDAVLITITGWKVDTTDMLLIHNPAALAFDDASRAPLSFVRAGAESVDAYTCRIASDPTTATIQRTRFPSVPTTATELGALLASVEALR